MNLVSPGGGFTAASRYMGHPCADLEWKQARKSEVSDPSLRAGVLGLLQVHSQAVVGGGGTVSCELEQLGPCPSWAHRWRRPFGLLLSRRLGQGQACLLAEV